MKRSIRFLTIALTMFLLLPLASCAAGGKTPLGTLAPGSMLSVSKNLTYLSAMSDASRNAASALSDNDITAMADFALDLMKLSGEKETNELVSPLSVMLALGMVTNGAWGDTRAELEETLGMSADELNTFLNSFVLSLINSADASLVSANSVWVSNDRGLSVRSDFIENVVRHYNAEIVSAPFGDKKTLDEINDWVNDNTDGMIKKILEKLNDDDIMVLLNALTFDADWYDKFAQEAHDGSFTNSDGSVCTAKMMNGKTHSYIEGKNCVGFKKNYAGGAYSYIALLPDKGTSIEKFISSLDGKSFLSLVNNAKSTEVNITLPKYSFDFELNMNDVLKAMGIKLAFDDEKADFTALGSMDNENNIYISQVIHKTHIEVDESGTRAAAVTAVVVTKTSSANMDPKTVTLDRPFVYAIIDNATGLPLFIGAVENLG